MTSVCYLEIDDEITGAIARLRAVRNGRAIVVVPPGSHIATSRINFKLLAREAGERGLSVVAVSDDPSVRALAISAGLPAYDSVPAAEDALKSLAEVLTKRGRAPKKATNGDKSQLTLTLPGMPTDAQESTAERPVDWVIPAGRKPAPELAQTTPAETRPVQIGRSDDRVWRRRRVGLVPIVAAVAALLVVAAVGYGAYLFLPTATITLQPSTTELRPEPITIVADPDVAVVDAATGVIPAEWLEIPLATAGHFSATGTATRETKATGVVRFRSENTVNDVGIVEGTLLSTRDGHEFETTQAAVVRRADFATSTAGQVDVPVRAVRAGPSGNVDAGAITDLPAALQTQLVSVRNPGPTSGGSRTDVTVVSQQDYDGAVALLTSQLTAALSAQVSNPAAIPRGLTVFPATARLDPTVVEPLAADVVDTELGTFTLSASTTARVLAVNETLVAEVADSRLRSLLQSGQQLVADKVETPHSAGTVVGETVAYRASPTARAFTTPDIAALTTAVRGKSISEARQILSAYGMVEIAMWPEFVDRLPDQTARISLVVITPSPRP